MKQKYFIYEVNDKRAAKEFIHFPVSLYRNEPTWIRPLDRDVEKVFDPDQNKSFRNGECVRWLLKDENGMIVGRVAAFVDRKTAYRNEQPTGGMGFFECINDKDAAYLLFDSCRDWLKERGMEAMDGPVNFGDRDRWWGLLVDGFHEPNYCMPYNFGYYKDLFESYGFRNYFNQYTYGRPITGEGIDKSLWNKAERVMSKPDYSFRNIDKKNLEKAAEEFRIIYNQAWGKHSGVKKITRIHAMSLLKSIKPVMDSRLIWFGYYKGQPIAFLISVPEMNQIVKKLNGKLGLVGKLKFLYYKWRNTCTKAFGVVFGVVPEHQGRGVESAIIKAFSDVAFRPDFPYRDMEMNWIGDFNPGMMKVAEKIDARIVKTHVTYRYLFDRNREFKRAGSLG